MKLRIFLKIRQFFEVLRVLRGPGQLAQNGTLFSVSLLGAGGFCTKLQEQCCRPSDPISRLCYTTILQQCSLLRKQKGTALLSPSFVVHLDWVLGITLLFRIVRLAYVVVLRSKTYTRFVSNVFRTGEHHENCRFFCIFCPEIVFLKLLTDLMIFSNKVMLHYFRLVLCAKAFSES